MSNCASSAMGAELGRERNLALKAASLAENGCMGFIGLNEMKEYALQELPNIVKTFSILPNIFIFVTH